VHGIPSQPVRHDVDAPGRPAKRARLAGVPIHPAPGQDRQLALGRFDEKPPSRPIHRHEYALGRLGEGPAQAQRHRDAQCTGDDGRVSGGRATRQGDAADELGPESRDDRRVKVVRHDDRGCAVRTMEIERWSAKEDVDDAPAHVTDVRRALAEVRVVHRAQHSGLFRGRETGPIAPVED
jgi:hypothetical protein